MFERARSAAFSAGHSISYETVLQIDNSIANDALKRYYDNGGKVAVPRNFTESSDSNYTHYAIDNIDNNEETLSGMGTFHATQSAALRRMDKEQQKEQLQTNPTTNRNLNRQTPTDLHPS